MSGKDHRHAVTILEKNYATAWDELLDVLTVLDTPLGPMAPYSVHGRPKVPKRQLKRFMGRTANAIMPISQTAMNAGIKLALRRRGWAQEPYILDREGKPVDRNQRGDFMKSDVFVEIEFGNTASFYRDLFKFHLAGTTGAAEVAIVVVATAKTARFFDQNVATYELAIQRLPHLRAAINIPLAIVGIEVADWAPVQDAYERMQAVVEENGETCHRFEVVFNA